MLKKIYTRNLLTLLLITGILALGNLFISVSAQSVIVKPTENSRVKLAGDPSASTSLAQRTSTHKLEHQASLSDYPASKITPKCSSLKLKISQISKAEVNKLNARQDVYVKLANRLGDAVTKLENQQLNTEALTFAQTVYSEAVNQFLASKAAYQTALEDVAEVDCTSDSSGFTATILEARKQRNLVVLNITSVKSSINDIKTALSNVKTSLDKADS